MKKRLLITSIVMMLVVAVALSTATYAWFTSNTSVSASVMTLRAATNDADALGIGWTGHGAESLLHVDMNSVLNPMAPKDLEGSTVRALANGTSIYEVTDGSNPKGIQFYTSTVKQDSGDIRFNNNGDLDQAVIYQHPATGFTDGVETIGGVKSFYITNLSKTNTIDTVKVYGVFSEIYNNAKYVITDDTTYDTTKTYYFKNTNGSFTEIAEDDDTTTESEIDKEYAYLTTYGFKSSKTYYECVAFYVQTADATVQPNVEYYTYNSTNSTYEPASDLTVGSVFPSGTTYYEFHNNSGDNLIRVALYKKEYRYAKDSTTQSTLIDSGDNQGKHQTTASGKYYRYEPNEKGANILKQVNLTTGTIIENLDYTLYCLDSDDHILFGILGQNDTELTMVPQGEAFDRTKVYYTASGTVVSSETEFNNAKKAGKTFYAKSDVYVAVADKASVAYSENTYYTKDGSNYSLANSNTFESATTVYRKYDGYTTANPVEYAQNSYYTVEFTQALVSNNAIASFSDQNVYYTAKNTVANGEITEGKKVNNLYYYSDVKAEMSIYDLKPGEQIDFVAVVWLDGTALDDTRAGNYAQVSLKFDAE